MDFDWLIALVVGGIFFVWIAVRTLRAERAKRSPPKE